MKPKRMISFSLSMSRIAYLFGAIGAKLVQTREKPLHFCKGFFSLISVWWSLRDSNPLPPACKAGALPAELRPQTDYPLYDQQSQM